MAFTPPRAIVPLIVNPVPDGEDLIDLILKHNANINIQDKEHCTALFYAVRRGFDDSVKLLLATLAQKRCSLLICGYIKTSKALTKLQFPMELVSITLKYFCDNQMESTPYLRA